MKTEQDPLISKNDSEQTGVSRLISLSDSIPHGNVSSEGSRNNSKTSLVHSRSLFKSEYYDRLDDSNDSFCKRRGVCLILCFAMISLLLLIIVIFNSQFAAMFGYQDGRKHILFQRYEKNWATLEQVDEKFIPRGWEYNEKCDNSHKFDLTFAVRLQNTEKLTEELLKTSLPESEDYGQHWTSSEVREFFAPKQESIDEIMKWLQYHEIDENEIQFVTKSKDFIRVNVDCEKANQMLNTEFGFWSNIGETTFATANSGTNRHLRVKDHYKVPSVVLDHLDFISPTLRFPMKHHSKGKIEFITSLADTDNDDHGEAITADTLNSYVTPNKLTAMYHLEDYESPSADTNQQAIASFLEEWFTYRDFYLFQTFFDVTRTKLYRNPVTQPDGDGDEAELDVQYVTSTGRGISTTVYDVEDDLYFITLAERIADSENPPFVCSISYGGSEQSNGWGYCNRASIELGKVSLLGVTFFVSSGDDGAAGDSTCDDYGEYQPSFPATSPYVVAVGGTTGGKVQNDASTSTEEAAWTYSGGGFSTYFDRMSWQDSAVTDYLNSSDIDLPDSDLYNSDGRAYPDISALSVYYIVCIDQGLYSVSGTSCSAPAVAGMFSQINDIRLQNGLSSLGWVNPRLYALYDKSQSDYFNDVIEGYNYGCDYGTGFEATKGWDPVTGVGTPKMSTMAPPLIYL